MHCCLQVFYQCLCFVLGVDDIPTDSYSWVYPETSQCGGRETIFAAGSEPVTRRGGETGTRERGTGVRGQWYSYHTTGN